MAILWKMPKGESTCFHFNSTDDALYSLSIFFLDKIAMNQNDVTFYKKRHIHRRNLPVVFRGDKS